MFLARGVRSPECEKICNDIRSLDTSALPQRKLPFPLSLTQNLSQSKV